MYRVLQSRATSQCHIRVTLRDEINYQHPYHPPRGQAKLLKVVLHTTKVQRLSFEYFTSGECSTNRDEEVNWVTTIPNSLPYTRFAALAPASVTPPASKIFKT